MMDDVAESTFNQQDFPFSRLTANLTSRLRWLDGTEDLESLTERLREFWGELCGTWENRISHDSYAKLGWSLLDAASACDQVKLVVRDVPLRGHTNTLFLERKSLVIREIKRNVVAKIIHAILEIMACSQQTDLIDTVENTAKSNSDIKNIVFLANIILVDINLGIGDFDKALAAARKIYAVSICGTSQ